MTTLSTPYPQRAHPLAQLLAALLGGTALFLLIVVLWTVGYQIYYAGRIFPGVSVAGVNLSGMTLDDATLRLSQTLTYPYTGQVVLRDKDRLWVASPAELGMVFDVSATARAAYLVGRSGGLFGSLGGQWRARMRGMSVQPVVLFDQRVAYAYLQRLASEIDRPTIEATLRVEGTRVIAQAGQTGRHLDVDTTLAYLIAQVQSFRDGEVPLIVVEEPPQVLDVSAQAETARRILSAPLTLTMPEAEKGDPGPWTVDIPTLAGMIEIEKVHDEGTSEIRVTLNAQTLQPLLEEIAEQIARQPENARFIFNDETRQLELIRPAVIGRSLNIPATLEAINDGLRQGQHDIPLVLDIEAPPVGDEATAEELGITELVSAQTSYFYGSSAERIQNIQTAAAAFHGLLVAPGETFSMGKALGDISLDNGYAEALIIYNGRTIKGVGGGVCQVSTTLFRTVFFGGYPVVERHPHAYRVSYYEQTASGAVDPNLAGLDATVYFPLVDFKFTNDTPYWLLMETYVDVAARKLTWKFYSTSDGRTVTWETTGPQNIVPAPKPLFQENPELKKNQIRQVDWSAEGADVVVTRTVWKNEEIYFQDEFRTHYEPWQAVCEYGPGTKNPEKLAKRRGICQP